MESSLCYGTCCSLTSEAEIEVKIDHCTFLHVEMAETQELKLSYSQFACIGSGFSAIGLGATLKRWYGITDVRFFERHGDLGGTWFTNQYPGKAHQLLVTYFMR